MRRRALIIGAVLLIALGGLGVALLLGGTDTEEPAAPPPDTSTTTIVEVPSGTPAPLTGLPVADDELHLIGRPALGVKIDNHPDSLPPWGMHLADIVLEVRVEGISRFLAVFHSREVGDVGPVRSARTSDPDLFAAFGRPLAAWSGANPATRSIMRQTEWIQDVSADRRADAYRRDRRARAPHNLVLDAPAAFDASSEPIVLPTPVFEYRDDGEAPSGEPVAGVELSVGISRSQYVWDAERDGWRRWSDGTALDGIGADDERVVVAPTNVVVLETDYVASEADPKSPEAVSVGEGRAWVYTGGNVVEGRWRRDDRTAPWTLTTADGAPIRLGRGSTWIAMPSERGTPVTMDAVEAAGLLDG